MVHSQSPSYKAHLLRLWRSDDHNAWHTLLQDVHSNAHDSFPSLGALFEFLSNVVRESDPGAPANTITTP